MLKSLVLVFAMTALGGALQQSPSPDPLAALAPLIGRWTGTSEGQPGNGQVTREYMRLFGSRFLIQARNRTVYLPQEKNAKGEVHEDVGIYSFDRARQRMVFRQFHSEGFVNQYVHEPRADAPLVFISEAIENIPAGWRARETLTLTSADTLEEVFELAEPGKDFALYSRSRLKRTQ
jgi:hypothetical protein